MYVQSYTQSAPLRILAPRQAFSLNIFRRYPSVVFSDWLDDIRDHLYLVERQLSSRPAGVLARFQALKARFRLIYGEAKRYCRLLAEQSAARRNRLHAKLPRFMWLISEVHQEALELLQDTSSTAKAAA